VRCNGIAPSDGLTQRSGRPADIAAMVVLLASNASQLINGQVLVVDGGMTSDMPIWSRARFLRSRE